MGKYEEVELIEGTTEVNQVAVDTKSPTHSSESGESVKLEKTVTILGGVGLIVGSIIGSGIFLSPRGVLQNTESIGLFLIVWVLSGIIALLGSLCYAELGTAVPKSGGEYAYLAEAFGPLPAFLFSWTATLVIRPSAGAIIAMIFAEYVARPFYDDNEEVPMYLIKLLAFFCLAIITFVNCISVKWTVIIQNVFTFAKLGCIALLIIIGFIELGKGHTSNFKASFNGTTSDVGKISLAFYSGLWAYDGWNTLNYVTEEMKNPGRDMPIAITVSIVIVVGCYLLCNVAYISVLGSNGILASAAVALELGDIYLKSARFIIPVLVGLSCFGAVNGLLFSSGRLVFAAAREKHLPSMLSMLQKKRQTPVPSLVFTMLISTIMLLPDSSNLGMLIDAFSFASWLFYGACFVALLWLRFRQPELNRPYKVFIAVPVLMVLVSLFLTILPIIEQPEGSCIALGIVLVGVPVYYIFVHFRITKYCPLSCVNCLDSVQSSIHRIFGLAYPDDYEESKENELALTS